MILTAYSDEVAFSWTRNTSENAPLWREGGRVVGIERLRRRRESEKEGEKNERMRKREGDRMGERVERDWLALSSTLRGAGWRDYT